MNERVSISLLSALTVSVAIAACSEATENPVAVEEPSFTHREGHNPGGGGGSTVESLNALSGVLTLVGAGGTTIGDNGTDEITITTHDRYTDEEAVAAVNAAGGGGLQNYYVAQGANFGGGRVLAYKEVATGTVLCEPGTVALSGGYVLAADGAPVVVIENRPIDFNGSGWLVTIQNQDVNRLSHSVQFADPWVTCATEG